MKEHAIAPSGLDVAASPSCTCFRLRKLGRLLSQRYDAALAPAGINVNQFSILRRADRTAHTIGKLAQELGMDRTTLTRDLKHLVDAQWVRLAIGEDSRQKRVVVTAAGKRVITRALPLWQATQDAVESGIGSSALAQLHASLDHLTRHMESDQ